MVGYPLGLADTQNNLPLLRRGFTASHLGIDFDGTPDVAVDVACFPGSSSSPVVIYDPQFLASSYRFLGVVYAGASYASSAIPVKRKIPMQLTADADERMLHLGYVVKAKMVRDLLTAVSNRT